MESSFRHEINNTCINDRKFTLSIQNLQNNMTLHVVYPLHYMALI
jgi:hypothetical protein